MLNFKKSIKKSELELRQNDSNNYIVVSIISRNGNHMGAVSSEIKKIMNTTAAKVDYKYGKVIIYCIDYNEMLDVMDSVASTQLLDINPDLYITISKKGKSFMNDSVSENKLEEAAGEISGDFITDFTYSSDDVESTMRYSPAEMAKIHVKWLIKQGLGILIEEKRYCFRYTIHYEGKAQYEALIKWLAWDFGMSETINNGCPKSERAGIEEIIAKGRWTMFN